MLFGTVKNAIYMKKNEPPVHVAAIGAIPANKISQFMDVGSKKDYEIPDVGKRLMRSQKREHSGMGSVMLRSRAVN